MALLSEGYGDDDMRELRLNLAEAAANPDPSQLRAALAHIVTQMTQGNSLSPLFPELIKICATSDLPSKKLVYLYMSSCACEQPSLTLLVINCLLKDCRDANPMVRGMALRTLCSLRLPLLLEYIEPPLLSGLRDKSAYVRRIAVLGCLKAFKLNSSFIKERNIVDQLCELVVDRDNVVVINVLCVLHELRGNLHVSQQVAHQLLNRLTSLSEWGQIKALQFLLQYQPRTDEEVFDILNLVDGCLHHPNSGVSLGAVHLMLHLTKDFGQVNQDVWRKLKGILLGHLSSNQPAFVWTALCHLDWLLRELPGGLTKYYKKFYCKYNEPTYLRCKRIDLLIQLTSDSNVGDIVGELCVYCTDVSAKFGCHAVKALATISQQNASYVGPCMDALLGLLQLGIDHLSSAILVQMQELLSLEGQFQAYASQVLDCIPQCWSTVEDVEGRCAMIWLIGHHGQMLTDAPYLLENAIDNIMEEASLKVKGHLLTATTKLFFSRPAECQDSLATLLQYCVETEKAVHLKEKALLYYKLLNTDPSKARMVMCSSQRLRTLSRNTPKGQQLKKSPFNSFSILLESKEFCEEQSSLPTTNPGPGAPQHPIISTLDQASTAAEEGTLVDLSPETLQEQSRDGLTDDADEILRNLDPLLDRQGVKGSAGSTDEGSVTNVLGSLDLHLKDSPTANINIVDPLRDGQSKQGYAGDSAADILKTFDPKPSGEENGSPRDLDAADTSAADAGGGLIGNPTLERMSSGTENMDDTSELGNMSAGSPLQDTSRLKQEPANADPLSDGDTVVLSSQGSKTGDSMVFPEGSLTSDSMDLPEGSLTCGPIVLPDGSETQNENEESSVVNASSLRLDPDCVLAPQDFEEKWVSWTNSETFEVRLGSTATSASGLLKKLNKSGLITMAVTPEDSQPWRAFMYAQTKTKEVYLVEVMARGNEGLFSLCIKYADQGKTYLVSQMVSLCRAAFIS